FPAAVRARARRRPAQDPDTKKLWRLVFQVENLRALPRSRHGLAPLVGEVLSQSVGPYRNALEERHDELTDPAEMPEAVRLAERLAAAIAAEQDIVIEPQGGLEIALRGMLIAAGVRHVPTSTTTRTSPTPIASPLTLFKALQLVHAKELETALERYVTFDLETTDSDVATCGVVELGAARVMKGEIVDRFHTLVQPYQPIAPRASAIHGYTDSDVRDARSFAQVWPGCAASSSAGGEFGRARRCWSTCSTTLDWRSRWNRERAGGREICCSRSPSSTRWADTAMPWRTMRWSARARVAQRPRSTR